MIGWLEKKVPLTATVVFRGSLPHRMTDLELPKGTEVEPMEAADGYHWFVRAKHRELGEAEIVCMRNPPHIPPDLFAFDRGMTDEEKEQAVLGRSWISIRMNQVKGHVLRDRKRLLRYAGAVMGKDGLVVMDHQSTRGWSRAMLDDELAHNADVDVEALYALHGVGNEEGTRCAWLHTHGLAELGKIDFDILNPHESLTSYGSDMIRALAFSILEDDLKVGTNKYQAYHPGGIISAVDAKAFDRVGVERSIRETGDDSHQKSRVVLCDVQGGFLSKLVGGGKVRASRALTNFPEDRGTMNFSTAATQLTAERSKRTWKCFREFKGELDEFGFPSIVKLGFKTDTGRMTSHEHMWFEVHEAFDDKVDATLMNEPFDIAGMKAGERGTHSLETMTDWQFMTPLGSINPRSFMPMRMIRTNPKIKEALRKAMAEHAGG
jgi:uncharacterized protein YegJ (DUF2314 family)